MSNKPVHPDEIFWRLEVEILPGKLDAFRSIVKEQIESAKSEPGTLYYEWYFNADKTVCHTFERYNDTAAVVAHATTFGEKFVERFLQTCRKTGLDVYGDLGAEGRALIDAFEPTYFVTKLG